MKISRITGDAMRDFIDQLVAAGLPADDIGHSGRAFWRFDDERGVQGYGGLEGTGPDLLLRSIVVPFPRRHSGMGRIIVAGLEGEARLMGGGRLHLLTTNAAGFFETAGFIRCDRATAPPSIASTAQFRSLCPDSASYLAKRL